MQPFELTEQQWNQRLQSAKSRLRGNYVPQRVTKASSSQMVGASKEIDWLYFGVKDDIKATFKKVNEGKLTLSKFGNLRLIVLIERPVTYSQVIKKARKQKLI